MRFGGEIQAAMQQLHNNDSLVKLLRHMERQRNILAVTPHGHIDIVTAGYISQDAHDLHWIIEVHLIDPGNDVVLPQTVFVQRMIILQRFQAKTD